MDLTFLTYNIHKGIGNDRLYNLDRIIHICKDIDADFIALQEVDHGAPRSRYEDQASLIAERLGMEYVLGLNVRLKQGSYGNAIFSRYPILKHTNINLTWTIKKPRACLAARVSLPENRELIVMDYHLGLAGIERIKQVKMLLGSSFLKDSHGIPCVMMGDSNDRAHKLNPILKKAGFEDTCLNTKIFTFPAFAPVWRLDKIFYNSRLTLKEHHVIRTRLTRTASDHLPVYAKFRI